MKKALILLMAVACLAFTLSPPRQHSLVNDGKIWSLLYQQQAAEYRALCFQAYNAAKWRLDAAIKRKTGKPYAVVTDIDETVLDNSPYDAARAVADSGFTLATWKKWTAKAIADTVPGAPDFFKYAASKHVAVFYVTNRDEDEMPGTIANLKRYGLPDADNAHILLRKASSGKEDRRLLISQKYNIAMLCGDNLPDFDKTYDGTPSLAQRKQITEELKNKFGSKYIVLPNPAYNDWEIALYKFSHKLTDRQKDSVILSLLKTDK